MGGIVVVLGRMLDFLKVGKKRKGKERKGKERKGKRKKKKKETMSFSPRRNHKTSGLF